MNKNLYIPGDLVMYESNICEIEECLRNSLFKSYDYTLVFPNGNSYRVKGTNVTPISLTPEILEKNERKFQYDKHNRIYMLGYIFLYADKNEKGDIECFSICVNGERIMPPIKYVHQLQHILFGLGLDSNIKL